MATMTLEEAAYISFATFRKNGNAVETPVWFAGDDADIDSEGRQCYYLFSAGDAGKVKRLRNFSTSRIAPCTVTGGILGDWHDTQAYLLDSDVDIGLALGALRKKYGWQMRLIDMGAKISGKFNRRAYIRVVMDSQ